MGELRVADRCLYEHHLVVAAGREQGINRLDQAACLQQVFCAILFRCSGLRGFYTSGDLQAMADNGALDRAPGRRFTLISTRLVDYDHWFGKVVMGAT